MGIVKQIIFFSFILIAIMVACVYLYINQDKYGTKTFYAPAISQKIIPLENIEEKADDLKLESTQKPEKVETPIKDEKKIDTNIEKNIDQVQEKIEEIEKPQIENTDIIIEENKKTKNTPNVVIPKEKKIEELSRKIQPKQLQVKKEEKIVSQNTKTQEEINAVVAKDKIFFKRLSTDITEKSYKVVEQIANILLKNKNVKIEVGGHTDAKGEADVNQWVSLQRAKSVKKELEKLGVSKDRITAKGYGESNPLVPNNKDGYSSENRRVEFKIIEE